MGLHQLLVTSSEKQAVFNFFPAWRVKVALCSFSNQPMHLPAHFGKALVIVHH
jgi:hypothetical protein